MTKRVEFTGRVVCDRDTVFRKVTGYYVISEDAVPATCSGELTIQSDETRFLFVGKLITDAGPRGEILATHVFETDRTMQFRASGQIR